MGWFLAFPATVAGIAAIVVRRRSADGEVREQLRLLLAPPSWWLSASSPASSPASLRRRRSTSARAAAVGSLAVLSATMAVAILRHRLYGLDVYVNRALVSGGRHGAARRPLRRRGARRRARYSDRTCHFGVALPATALVAIAFQPVRDRLQRRVNRLLYGQRDEPYAAISTLGRRLGETMAPADVLPVMVETIADALRLPYVAVELADSPGDAGRRARSRPRPESRCACRSSMPASGSERS